MTKLTIKFQEYTIDLAVHEIGGEVAEVYAYWNGQEIAYGTDLDMLFEDICYFFKAGEDMVNAFEQDYAQAVSKY